MSTHAPHLTPHAGASYAHWRRIARDAGKNAVWRRAPRARRSSADVAQCVGGAEPRHAGRVTATAGRTQSA
ncbi:MAG: hypothetical protein RLZZ15_2870 [Verrucomicrobiota bacterium]|jgi:hypothetical protein